MSDFLEQIKSIAQDLINLEVNTILKDNMTGRKMPKPRHALIDIAQNYEIKLNELGFPLKSNQPGGFAHFDQLREKADEAIHASKANNKDIRPEDVIILYRIKRMSDQIKGVFRSIAEREKKPVEQLEWNSREEIDKQPPLPLTTDELVLIRKIWEMGVEEIAMQTVIQLDGDVVTRIQRKHIGEQSQILHKIHNQNISTSIQFWGQLIGIVQEFFKGFAKAFSVLK